jgi:phosphate starvation-inducible membrane PsiE
MTKKKWRMTKMDQKEILERMLVYAQYFGRIEAVLAYWKNGDASCEFSISRIAEIMREFSLTHGKDSDTLLIDENGGTK